MATYTYEKLKKRYRNFDGKPAARIIVNGKDLEKELTPQIVLMEVEVENTVGYEASIASFRIGGFWQSHGEHGGGQFELTKLKKTMVLGNSVTILMGYEPAFRTVFKGFISRINLVHPKASGEPGAGTGSIIVTAMDVKGVMMASSFHKQLRAKYYSQAVEEIFHKTAYTLAKKEPKDENGVGGCIQKILVEPTPDKDNSESYIDRTMEMVGESDYEFVVKAAKKFNYEFFVSAGYVTFRKRMEMKDILLVVDPKAQGLLQSFDISYDISGLVSSVEVRGMDPEKGVMFTTKEADNKRGLLDNISVGNAAKNILSSAEMLYIDPTIKTLEEAKWRQEYLKQENQYRFCTMEAEVRGLPEFTAGRFITFEGYGEYVNNTYYLEKVRHVMRTNDALGGQQFWTELTGKAPNKGPKK